MKLEDITEKDIWNIADSSAIVARGLDYYETDQIASLTVKGEKITARVRGSYGTYDVEIMIENGNIQADCDCPYDGYGCKHIVAVLYKWVRETGHKSGARTMGGDAPRKEIDIDRELSKLGKNELVSILSELCSEHEDARRDVLLRIPGNPDAAHAGKEIILRQITDAFDTEDGFIDYNAVFTVVRTLEEIKKTVLSTPPDIRSLLLKALADEGLDAIGLCDDSSGQMGEFIIECLTDLGKSIHDQSLSFDENKILIQENLDLRDKEQYGLGYGYINLVLEIPSTEEDFAFLIDELKSRMERQKESYGRGVYKDMLTEIYRRAGEDNEYLALLEENAREEGEFLPLVRFWQEQGDLKKAICLAEEGIKKGTGRWEPDFDLFAFLEEIYRTQNNKEDLLRVAVQFFNKWPSLIKYKEIKTISEELHEWDSVRPGLMGASDGQELVEIYLFEKEYDKAFQSVMGVKGRFSDRLRDRVASAMMQEHPDKALQIYIPMVQEFIGMAKRDYYGVAALYAKKVKEIYLRQGQEDIWKGYIARIRAENKGRPALIDEFRRL